jgi:predicted DNA-binding transcriptional regulator YafY
LQENRLHEDRFNRVERLFKILALVKTCCRTEQRCTLKRLAAECHCSTKTIQRDLQAWEALEVPISHNGKSYVLHGDLPFHILELGRAEAMALALAEVAAVSPTGLQAPELIEQALSKVHALAPPEVARTIEAYRDSVLNHESLQRDYSQAPLQALLEACRRRERVLVDYDSQSSGRRVRPLEVYRVVFRDGFWLVIGRDPEKNEVRNFALNRFYGCQFTTPPVPYKIPERWNLADYMRGSLGVLRGESSEVVLLFDSQSARWARERRWRVPTTWEELEDGTLRMRATVAGLEEIAREVLQWGRHVTVEAPEQLRARIRDEAEAIARKYR